MIYTSGLKPEPPNPAVVAPSHHATEQALKQSGLGWTILRNSLYADYQLPEAKRAIETGELVHNRGRGVTAYVAREDCAAVAAAVLLEGGHESAVYDITGREAFSADDLAAGRKTEIDYINGELVRLAERLNVDAPVNEAVLRLIRGAEAGHGPWSARDLRREVLGW